MVGLKLLPDGVEVSNFSMRVVAALAEYTSFPWAILQAQCKRQKIDPANLSPKDLEVVLPNIRDGVARFSTAEKGENAFRALHALIG